MSLLTVADIFSDHMVLRHSRLNPVWGTAPAGAEVEVRLAWKTASCCADDQGRWTVWIDAPGPGSVTRMTVRCGEESVAFEDVACGEVWLAGGQSNMELPLMCMNGAAKWADDAVNANVRLKKIPRRTGEKRQAGWHFYPTESYDEPWQHADRDSAAKFSAIGYVFGAMLAKKLHMPVGVIECNWGGTMIQSWMPTDHIMAHEDTRRDMAAYQAARDAMGEEKAREVFEEYQRTVRQAMINEPDFVDNNLKDPLNFLKEDRNIAFIPMGGDGSHEKPGVLYDYMVARVAPYGLSGVLWYQGEANGMEGEAQRYADLFGRMLRIWRGAWMDPKLPFLTCQLAPFLTSLYWGDRDNWPELRRQQELCSDLYSRTSMAVLLDVGMERNIHPLDKEPVAERLYRLALEDVYGIPAQAHAARPVSCTLGQGCVTVCFTEPVEMREGEKPMLLTVAGRTPARVEQPDPCTLALYPQEDGPLQGACYAQSSWLVPGLFDHKGLPVAPFRMTV